MRHRRRVNIAIAAAVLLALTLGGCAGRSNGAPATSSAPVPTVPGVDLTSEVDVEVGVITFPADRFGVTIEDQDVLASASSAALAECARSVGVRYHAVRIETAAVEKVSTYFGVWRERDASEFGFVKPQTPADMAANGIHGGPDAVASGEKSGDGNNLSSADLADLEPCQSAKDVKRFGPSSLEGTSPWNAPLGELAASFYGLDEVKSVVRDYDACLSEKHLKPSADGAGFVAGADSRTISAEQIELALDVVACKDAVHYVQRLADVMAAKQAPIIAKYARDMVAYRKRVDAMVADAKKYLAGHADETGR